jgi:UDP:flavonoid glycosyltransferase YjiC (YdhE family)
VRSGAGLYLPAKEVTVERLVQALAQLLPDLSKYRANAQTLRDEFASLGGIQRAALLLVDQK